MIRLEGVSKAFNIGKPSRFSALRDVSISVAPNEVLVFKGPSGSGKTTLLSIIGCMSRPTSGRIWIEDTEVTTLPERLLSRIRRRSFGFMFQNFQLIESASVLENVTLPSYPSRKSSREIQENAMQLLDDLGISGKAHDYVKNLSGGEQQRTALARALINEPRVLLADEPTAHLDSGLSRKFLDIISQLQSRGRTILMASHDPLVFQSGVTDRIIEIRDGQLGGEEGADP